MIVSHKLNAGVPSMRNPASSDIGQLLCCYGIQRFALYKPVKLAHTYAVQMCTEHHLTKTLSLPRNRRLGRIQVCSLLLDSQRDNAVCSLICDECT